MTKLRLFNNKLLYFRHLLEVQLLEEIHTEELEWYKLKLAKAATIPDLDCGFCP
jgi:hypothetical protein